jgi:hypothetical protein
LRVRSAIGYLGIPYFTWCAATVSSPKRFANYAGRALLERGKSRGALPASDALAHRLGKARCGGLKSPTTGLGAGSEPAEDTRDLAPAEKAIKSPWPDPSQRVGKWWLT